MSPTNFYIYLYQFKKKNEYLDGEVMKSILEISERTYRYSEKNTKAVPTSNSPDQKP